MPLLDAPAVAGTPSPRGPRWRALGMVVLTLAMTVVMVWTGTGTSEALVGNVLKRATVGASRFVAKNALRIGETVQNVQGAILDRAVKAGARTALWSFNTWRDLTEDEEIEGLPMPAPVREAVESPDAGFARPASGATWCTINLAGQTWSANSLALTTTNVRHMGPPILSDSNYNSTCNNNWATFFRADARCVKTTGESFTRTDMTLTTLNGSVGGGACRIGTDLTTVDAQLRSVFVYPKPDQNYLKSPTPWELVNPEFKEITYNESTMTGRKKCVNEFDPTDVQMVERVGYGTEMLPMVPCPPGYYPEWVEYEHQLGDGTPVRKLGRIEINPGAYPQCEMGQCELTVSVDEETCVVGLEKCYDWMATEPASRVKCQYGPYAVGFEECEALEFAYRTQAGMTIDPQEQLAPGRLVPANPDGTIAPGIGPGTGWAPDPNPGGNPNPNPNPDPDGTGTGFPSRGSNPNPNPGGRPIRDAEHGGNCLSSAWSWNPVEWVFTPVKCALTWAAVPKPEALAAVRTRVQASANKSGVGDWFAAVPALFTLPGGGGCGGPVMTFPMTGTEFRPADACSEPMSTVAGLSKAFITVVVVTVGVLHGTRAIAGAFGYSFSMSGKGSADGD